MPRKPPGATQVRSDAAGRVARCSCCGLALRQVDGFDADVALGTLLQHHPESPSAVHRPTVPPGWRVIDLTDRP